MNCLDHISSLTIGSTYDIVSYMEFIWFIILLPFFIVGLYVAGLVVMFILGIPLVIWEEMTKDKED